MTAPGVISWAGPTISVDVTVPDSKPVFVGVANTVDVEDDLQTTDRIVLDRLRLPWEVETEEVTGRPFVPAAPTAIDWWIASALRTEEGGALVVATLVREDGYAIDDGTRVNWPADSEQEAFLAGDLYSAAVLRYFYQLLVYVPPAGTGTPFVMGHYGGVVAADGY